MSSILVDPGLFCAFAIADKGGQDVLPRGTHVRLLPSPALGFPLAPFALWPVKPQVQDLAFEWHGRDGQKIDPPNFDAAGGEMIGSLMANPAEDGRVVGVQGVPGGGGAAVKNIAILDKGGGRLVVERSDELHTVAAPQVAWVRLRGIGPLKTLFCYVVTPSMVLEASIGDSNLPEQRILSLPVEGETPWYADGRGRDPGLRRVKDGAPQRWTPPDRPDGPFDALSPNAELARLEAFRQNVDDRLKVILADAGTPPWAVSVQQKWERVEAIKRPWQKAEFPSRDTLLVQALDPGLARYLGLMTRLDDLSEGEHPTVWAAAGVFAVDRGRPAAGGARVSDILPDPDDFEKRLLIRMQQLFPRLGELANNVRARGLEVRALVAPAAAAPPPDLFWTPAVSLRDANWRREKEGVSVRYSQSFVVENPPLAVLSAIGRLNPTGWDTRHQVFDLPPGSNPPKRAAPMLLAVRQTTDPKLPPVWGHVADVDIPAEGAPWLYRLRLGDLFGRFGREIEVSVPAPPRPPPPRPSMQTHLHPNAKATHDNPAPFGRLEINVPVPEAADLTAGSRGIASVEVRLDGAAHSAAPGADRMARLMLDLPALQPMETRSLTVEARFLDEDGKATLPPPDERVLKIVDPRPPKIIPTGPGILWTSRPGPAEDVELKLAFPGEANARYRAYLADAAGLDLETTDPDPPTRARTRAEIAVDGANRARDGQMNGKRDRFRLLTEPALVAGPDGWVRLDERLPRTLATVQFLRIVPVSANGSEADFDACGLVPVVVPSDRKPPAPHVTVTVNGETGVATVTVEAVGVDLESLRAAEPAFFETPEGADVRRPEFRLRRASGFDLDPAVPDAAEARAPDPLYAREIARGEIRLETGPDGPRVVATFDDTASPLLPFVRYAYWADARLPPERRLPPGVVEVPPAGGVEPIEARQIEASPGMFSLTSIPATAMHVPPAPPALKPEQVQASLVADVVGHTFSLDFRLQDAPRVSARAIGSYRLKLWKQEDNLEIASTGTPVAVADGEAIWKSAPLAFAGAAPPSITFYAALADPLGRTGPVLAIAASPTG